MSGVELDFKYERITNFVQSAIERARSVKYAKISDTLIDAVPDLIIQLRGIITSPDATPAQRLKAADMLMSCWASANKSGLREDRKEISADREKTKRALASAEKAKAKASEKTAIVEINREQKKIDRQLAKIEKSK